MSTFDKVSYDQGYQDGHSKGFERGKDFPNPQIKIEALRLSVEFHSQICAAVADSKGPLLEAAIKNVMIDAEQFAAWLEG